MSTEINIKKRIDIQEEGVSITPDVNSINFTGAGVTASATGNDVTVDITSAAGTVLYYMNQTVTQAPYKEFSSTGTTAAEQVIPATVAGGATATIASYQTASGVPNTIVIPQGLWQLFLHFNATTAGQNWIIRPLVYKRDLGGIETLIFTIDPIIVTNMSTVTTLYTSESVIPNTALLTTDRIVVKINVENTTGVSQTVNFRTEGSQHYSVATTTLNQVITAGSVTSVTGTAPIASSGGAAPAISISQSGAASDGYLSSTDWNTFNNKVDDNIYTTDGTLTGDRIVNLNSNSLTFGNGIVNVNNGSSSPGTIRLFEDSDNGTNYTEIKAHPLLPGNTSFTFPVNTGASGQYLLNNGAGISSWNSLPAEITAAASDETTALTTGTAKVTFRVPHAINLTSIRASLTTAQTSGSIFTVNVKKGGISLLSTLITIDNGERTSTTAVTPPALATSVVEDDAEITIDINQIGDGTAKGLKVTLIGVRG